MKKIIKVALSVLMGFSLLYSSHPVETKAYENPNIALNKVATESSVYPNSGKTGAKAVDGIIDDTTTKVSRWSSKRLGNNSSEDYDPNLEQWLLVDLGGEYTVSQINVFWEAAYAKDYKLQGSLDGNEFFDIEVITGNTSAGLKKHRDFEPVETRYIRVLCQTAQNNSWGYSIYELEVYQNKVVEGASDVIDQIEAIPPTISADGKHVILPNAPEGYEISIYGTDNEQVVDKNGNIIQPLVDMDVNFTYKIVNANDSDDWAVSSVDTKITVPGLFTQTEQDNVKPNVVPGLREWKGSTGYFTLGENAQIVCASENEKEAADLIQTYFRDMLEKEIKVVTGEPKAGDIYLKTGSTEAYVGSEGYNLTIDDYITIEAPTYKGLIYGGASVTQILYQSDNWDQAPKGICRDYPQYSVRAGMVDVGRTYIPLEYLKEMSIYMSWFKMNEMHVHINDCWGGSGYSAFRLESEVYPELTAKDGYYTKDDYRQFQKDMIQYGMNVITEIDTPSHSGAFASVEEAVLKDFSNLDIDSEEGYNKNLAVMKKLFDEYLGGDNPVFISNNFHIGTDEYSGNSSQLIKWTKELTEYVYTNYGKNVRMWASNGNNGENSLADKATVNLWANYAAKVQDTFDAGYDVINTDGGWLYIVPAGNAGYPDRYNMQKLYNEFEVNYFNSARNGSKETPIMPAANPQIKGASFAIWNDMTSFKTGFSWFDIYDRMKDAVSLIAEKTWFGEDEPDQSYEQFRARIDALQNKVPNANPGRYVETKGSDLIAEYDLKTSNSTIKDTSENSYDATAVNATNANGGLKFNGNGYMSLPMESVGYPYTVSMRVSLDEINENTILFNGSDGTLYANLNGKIGYARGAYHYTFDYTLKENQEVTLTFTCTQKDVTLYVNGRKVGTGKLTNETIGGKAQQSSTFALPTEKLFENTSGTLYELSLYNYAMNDQQVKDLVQCVTRENIALNKPASASALEVNDGRFTAEMAVDGVVGGNSRVSFAKADEQWLLVDLGKEYTIDTVVLDYESAVGKYEIQVSTDGEKFETVYTKNEDTVMSKQTVRETVEFEPVQARYVRYVQKEMWHHTNNSWYSGSIYEFEVYQAPGVELLEKIALFEEELNKYEPGTFNGQLNKDYYDSIVSMLEGYKDLAVSEDLSVDAAESAMTTLVKEMPLIAIHINYVKQEAIDAYNELKNLDKHDYTSDSFKAMSDQLDELQIKLDEIDNYQDVAAYLDEIKDIKDSLVAVDSTQLEAKIKEAEKLNLSYYKETANIEKALEEAREVYDSPASQDAINQAYETLDKAIKALEYKDADYSAVEKAKEKVPTDLSIYTEESVKALNDALAGVVEGKNITEQEEVDAMAKAIENAINGLVKKDIGKPEDPSKPSEPTTPTDPDSDKPETPNTSDTTNIIVYIGALIIAAISMVLAMFRRKRAH